MQTSFIPAAKAIDSSADRSHVKNASEVPQSDSDSLLAAQQLSLLGGQPESFAVIQAQALAQFSEEQGEELSAQSLLSEVGISDADRQRDSGNILPALTSHIAESTAIAKNSLETTATLFNESLRQLKAESIRELTLDERLGNVGDKVESDLELSSLLREIRSAQAPSQSKAPLSLSVSQNAYTDPAWGQAMTARVSWMISSGVQNATIHLHPEELGSIQVQVKLDGDHSRVQFQAQQAETGELIEKMLPRLTQGFEQQGLRLDEVKVSVMNNPNGNANTNSSQSGGEGFAQTADEQGKSHERDLSGSTEADASLLDPMRSVILGPASGVDDYA